LIPFVIAALLALAPVLVAHRCALRTTRVVVAMLFALGVLAALASIGVFFVSALIALIAAATIDEDAPTPTPASRQRPT